jgi:hypothetical protein
MHFLTSFNSIQLICWKVRAFIWSAQHVRHQNVKIANMSLEFALDSITHQYMSNELSIKMVRELAVPFGQGVSGLGDI